MKQHPTMGAFVFLVALLLVLILVIGAITHPVGESWEESELEATCIGLVCPGVPWYQQTLTLFLASGAFFGLLGLLFRFMACLSAQTKAEVGD